MRFQYGEATEKIRITLEGARVVFLPPQSKFYTRTGLSASTTYNSPGVAVMHQDRYGGRSASVEDTVTTTAAQPTLSKPNSIQIIEGANIGTGWSD